MDGIFFDVSHLLAGSLVLLSFVLLYQDRLGPQINVFALQSLMLSAAVAWQAVAQDAYHLLVTAGIAVGFKAVLIPIVLHRMIRSLGIR
jgi:hydrogenase-4 component E